MTRKFTRTAAAVAAAVLVPLLAGCGGASADAEPTPLPVNGETEYMRVGNSVATPLSASQTMLEVPASPGFDGGTTVLSVEPDSAWTWDTMPDTDNDTLYGGVIRAVVNGGWGECQGWVGFVRDGSAQETRWTVSDENYGRTLAGFFAGRFGVEDARPYTDLAGDIVMPFHEEGAGQFRFAAYDIPAGVGSVPFDTKVWIGPDYNTGYMTALSVSCIDSRDYAGVFEQMASPGNPYTVYVDVLPEAATPAA